MISIIRDGQRVRNDKKTGMQMAAIFLLPERFPYRCRLISGMRSDWFPLQSKTANKYFLSIFIETKKKEPG